MTLLDFGMPIASWLGIAITALLSVLTWLVLNFIKNITTELEDNKEQIRKLEQKINDLHIIILGKIADMVDKFMDNRTK